MNIESFDTFRANIKGRGKTKKHKVSGSYGTYDYYKYYRKNRPKDRKYILTESQYFAIVRKVNKYLREELVEYGCIPLLSRMGSIEIRKYEIKPRIGENGELIFNAPIDWDRTLKLWYDDTEAYKNRTLIKVENREIFRNFYNKTTANYKNKTFYYYMLNKEIKCMMNKKIKEGKMDAFELNKGF